MASTTPRYNLRIHDPATLDLYQDLAAFESFSWSRHVREMGDFTLVVNDLDLLPVSIGHDRLIVFRRNGIREFVGLVKTCVYNQDTRKWTFTGFDLKWFLKSRVVIPPAQTPASAVHSWASDTPTAGTYTLRIPKYAGGNETTADINWDDNLTAIQAAVDAVLEGDESVTVGGTAPTGGGPVTFTFGGSFAERAVTLIEVRGSRDFDGGIVVNETTKGVPPRAYYHTVSSVSTETAMREYVNNHLGTGAVADIRGERDLNKYLSGIDFNFSGIDLERGDTITYNARYQNLLSEVLVPLSEAAEGVYFDVLVDEESATHGYRFHVYGETDATSGQTQNPRVVFGVEFGKIANTTFTNDRSAEITTAYLLDPERLEHRVLNVYDISQHDHSDHVASDFRSEDVLDGRDELSDDEKFALAHNLFHSSVSETLESTPLDSTATYGYRVDWDIGHKVTIALPRISYNGATLQKDLLVTSIQGTLSANGGETIDVTFGDHIRQIEDYLSENFSQINSTKFAELKSVG